MAKKGRIAPKEAETQLQGGKPGGSDSEKRGDPNAGEGPIHVPGWLPAVLYGIVTLALFRKFVFTGEMLFSSDTLSLGYMARAFFAESLREGVFPLWNPIILGGTPFLNSLAGGDSLYPTSVLLLLLAPFRALGWKLILHVFLSGLFTFGWVRSLGRSRPSALLAGLAYLLAPFMVTLVYPGHDGKLFVTALTPLLFWAVEASLVRGRILSFVGMALVVALVILTTHFQQAYFLFGAVGIYAVVRSILLWRRGMGPGRAAARFGLFLGFSLLGAGVAGIQLFPAVQYVLESSRRTATTTRASEEGSVAYSSSWSMHPEEAVAMVVPEFVGSSVGGAAWAENTYWGRNVFKLNHEYAGLIVLLLAVASFFGAPARGVRFAVLGIGAVALLYTLGTHTPVWRIFYEVVPGISLFRAPSIAAFLFGFGAVTLMAFGVDRILGLGGGELDGAGRLPHGGPGPSSDRRLLLVLGGATGVLFLGTLLSQGGALISLWTSSLYQGIDPGKLDALTRAQPFITRGFLVATLLSGVLLALSWGVLRNKLPALLWLLGIGALLVVDEVRVDDPFIQTMDFHAWSAPDPNILYLQERLEAEEPFRVLAMGGTSGFGQDVKPGIYGLELANGHHPNDLARYRELIGMVGSGAPANLIDLQTGAPNLPLLSILNVRYVIWPVQRFGGLPAGDAVAASSMDGRSAYEAVYEIPTLPRARLVGEAVILPEGEAMGYLLSPLFRPEMEVVLPEDPPLNLPGRPVEGEIRWLERGVNRMRLSVRAEEDALLVLAENWFPAWKARVGEEDTPVLRANHTLRAVPIPRGIHEVEVYFDAGTLRGALLTSIGALLILGALGGLGYLREGGRAFWGRETASIAAEKAPGPKEDPR
ncbi:MAG: hypothetical protein ACWGSQ_08885 [Longimicrobiales bacterium]